EPPDGPDAAPVGPTSRLRPEPPMGLPPMIQLIDHWHGQELAEQLTGPADPFPIGEAEQVQPRGLRIIEDQIQLVTAILPVRGRLLLTRSLRLRDAVPPREQ